MYQENDTKKPTKQTKTNQKKKKKDLIFMFFELVAEGTQTFFQAYTWKNHPKVILKIFFSVYKRFSIRCGFPLHFLVEDFLRKV